MNEQDWLQCQDPRAMLELIRRKTTVRKHRLFAAACCRRIYPLLLSTQRAYRAVVVAERLADGLHTTEDCAHLRDNLFSLGMISMDESNLGRRKEDCILYHAAYAAAYALLYGDPFGNDAAVEDNYHDWIVETSSHAAWAAAHSQRRNDRDPVHSKVYEEELAQHVPLVHDVFGNPFRPVALDPLWLSWREALVVRLAKSAYEEWQMPGGELSPARLAILGDALEEAGCTDPAILDHCRRPGVHVRGCHLLDLILGKT